MTSKLFKLAGAVLSASLLAGCGGGGGDSSNPTAVAATTPFNLQGGYQALVVSGANNAFMLSGDCTGAATISTTPAVQATFEGVDGFASTQTSTIQFTGNCSTTSTTGRGTTYYDAAYTQIGLQTIPGEYDVCTTLPTLPPALPTSVMVGASGTIETLNTYADSTKASQTGTRVLSYVIEADTATTAIANLVTKAYNPSNQLLSVQQSRYRIAADGSFSIVSIDVQFSTTSTFHLVYTPTAS